MPTLSQRFRSFLTELMAEILPRFRRDYPLPPPINRGGFDILEEEKIGSKNRQKLAFSAQFSCNKSFLFFLSPPWPSASTTLIIGLSTISFITGSHQSTTESHREPFSLLSTTPPIFFFFFCFLSQRPPSLPQPQPPTSRQPLLVSTSQASI